MSPRSVVLNFARVTPQRSLPVRRLLEVGRVFGFTANAMRVAITRLAADGMLESDERGSYRIGPAAAAVNAHVEGWRRGEARMRDWDGTWIAVAMTATRDRAERRLAQRALTHMGLCQAQPGLWVRPDNLALSWPKAVERLRELGAPDGAQPFRCRDFDPAFERMLRKELWPTERLERGYRNALGSLERSLAKLDTMPRDAALVQTYLLGGEAIRVLATDPLLPEEMMPGATRRRLTERMLEYDALGHKLWTNVGAKPKLKLVQGGAEAAGRGGGPSER